MTPVEFVLLGLILTGFVISSYFTLLAYRWIEPTAGWIPSFCRLGEKTCASVIFTPRARLLGVPNSLMGQAFYLALAVGIAVDRLLAPPYFWAYLSASLLTVLVGLFLTYSLLFLTRIPCTLCFVSHALNLGIFLLLIGSGPI